MVYHKYVIRLQSEITEKTRNIGIGIEFQLEDDVKMM